MLRRNRSIWVAVVPAVLVSGAAQATTHNLGNGDSFAIDQPRVAVQFEYPAVGPTQSWPEDPGTGFTMILDTGASGYLLAQGAHQDLFGDLLPAYPIAGPYAEQGVGGFEEVDVTFAMKGTTSAFLGIDDILGGGGGTPPGGVGTVTNNDVRAVAAPGLNIGSFDGIVGMPAMSGNAVVIDLSAMVGGSFGIDYIHVGFTDDVATHLSGQPANTAVHTFNFGKFPIDPATGQIDDGPLPSAEDLPVLGGVGVHAGGNSASGNFLFDTGAQISMISREKAIALGIDPDDPNHEFITVGGVGGEIDVPLVQLDKLTLDTAGGTDTLEFDNIAVGIIDIPGLPLDGILGFNAFTTGYLPLILEALNGDVPTEKGAFLEMVLDFSDNDQWQMHLVRNTVYEEIELGPGDDPSDFPGGTGLDNLTLFAWPAFSLVVPEPGSLALIGLGAMTLLRRRR
jgi:hypothetical protein